MPSSLPPPFRPSSKSMNIFPNHQHLTCSEVSKLKLPTNTSFFVFEPSLTIIIN